MAQTFYSIHDQSIAHAGIKGQKWGLRRFRNYDGTLTAAGKERYDYYDEKGGKRAIKKAEKQERRRQKILADPKKLQRHFHEFSTAELQKAKERFDAQNALKEQFRSERMAQEKYKADIATTKANTEKQKQLAKQQKLQTANTKATNKFNLEKAKREEERKIEKENKQAKTDAWKQRMLKLSNILTISKNGKEIFDELGITDPKDGKTLFGSLGKALGWDTKSVGAAAKETAKEAVQQSKAEESKTASSASTASPSASSNAPSSTSTSRPFAGWEGGRNLSRRYFERQEQKEQRKLYKDYAKQQQAVADEILAKERQTQSERDSAIKDAAKSHAYRLANDTERKMTESLDSSKNANVRVVDNLKATLSERIGAFVDQTSVDRAVKNYKNRERATHAANKRWERRLSVNKVKQGATPNVSGSEYAEKMQKLFSTNVSDILGKYKG